jgi:hypothetical protein
MISSPSGGISANKRHRMSTRAGESGFQLSPNKGVETANCRVIE